MFHSARIKLTAYYLLIIMFISVAFSGGIYRVLLHEVERFERAQRFKIENRLHEGIMMPFGERLRRPGLILEIDPGLLAETRQRIIWTLIVINGIVFGLSGWLGYLLAGRTLSPIKTMVEEQNRFISDASHELKTPLTSLRSAFEVYLRGKKPTLNEAKGIISESLGEVDRLQILSESLLQLAQYQKPNGNNKFEKLLIGEIMTESIKKTAPMAKVKEVSIKSSLKDVKVKGVKYSLVDLFTLILDNAVKYSCDKSEVWVRTRKFDGQAEIEVSDKGIGIAEGDLSHIFERFYRVDNARRRSDQGGYGLGLAIAKRIVEIHKGTIDVESKVGVGTTVRVKLPASA